MGSSKLARSGTDRGSRRHGLKDLIDEKLLGQGAFDRTEPIDHSFGHCVHAIAVGKIGEFHGFDAVSLDEIVLHGEALS
jgi:hypothetical protein